MKITNKLIFIIFIVFIIGIFFWAIFIPKEDISSQIHKTMEEQGKKADVTFKEVTFEEISAGVKYWKLLAQNAMLNKSTQIATLKTAKGTFYKAGKPALLFLSPAALWDMRKKEILLDKPIGYDVLLEPKIKQLAKRNSDFRVSTFYFPPKYRKGLGFWFMANNLSWKFADQKLLCQGEIILNKGEVTAFCDRLESDVAMEKAVLQGNPHLLISPNNMSSITVEAQIIEVISAKDTIQAEGIPRILWDSAVITCEKIQYVQQKELLKLISNVVIVYKDITAKGNTASYDTRKNIIVLEGGAQAVQGENQLTGDKVKVNLKENKISVMGKGKVTVLQE